MTEENTSAWQEIKEGMNICFKIILYSAIGVGIFAGVGYVYLHCFY